MASAVTDLECGLIQVGHKLSFPPSDTVDLLSLLDQTQFFLSKVDQSPSKSMSAAIRPARDALVAKNLIKHSHEDVRVAVASCISEITRITAPNAPYSDEHMRVIFKLIVDTFGKLDDMSSRSFSKRILILEIAARILLCVMKLDLGCDTLIVDMFRHFIKTISPHHPDKVFQYMVLIMTLVLEECDSDVTAELVCCLLDGVRKDNKEVLPIAHRLAGEVLGNCAGQIKSFLMQVNSDRCARQQILKIDGQLQESLISGLESISNLMKEVHLREKKANKAKEEASKAGEEMLSMVEELRKMKEELRKMKEEQLCEKKANKAKEEASKAGEEILSKVEELRKMMKHYLEANNQNEKVYAENDIFVTGSQGFSRLLSLSEDRNKSSSIIQQIHRSLEARLAAAEKELAAQQLEKEESADKLLNEHQLLTKNMVGPSRMLMSLEARLAAAEKELAAQQLEIEESADKLLNEHQLLTKNMVEPSRMLMSLEARLAAAEKELAALQLEKEESTDKLLNEHQLLTKNMVEQSRMLMQEEENAKLRKLLSEGGHIVDKLVKEAILAQEYVSSLQKRIGGNC